MQRDRERHLIQLSDGMSLRRTDFVGHIAEVAVPFGGKRRCVGHGLRRDQEALVISVLVVPVDRDLATADLGIMEFWYNDKPKLVAPVRALMNRYAGLTRLAQLQERMRLAGLLLDGMDEWDRDVVFAHPMVEPVLMHENLGFFFRHVPPAGFVDYNPAHPFVVEIQALIKNPTGEPEFFRWEPIDVPGAAP